MKSAQLAILLVAIVATLLSIVEAKPTQTVHFGKKHSGKSTWFNGHDLKAVACYGDLMGNSH
ncbi:hypothetical protein BGZ88_006237, partial [Linnemannia elongata]